MTVALLIPTYFRWKHTYSHRFQIPGLPIPDSKFQVCQWSSWSYGPCSVSCGQGLQPATRQKQNKIYRSQLFSDGFSWIFVAFSLFLMVNFSQMVAARWRILCVFLFFFLTRLNFSQMAATRWRILCGSNSCNQAVQQPSVPPSWLVAFLCFVKNEIISWLVAF